jgi:hypothetical protein
VLPVLLLVQAAAGQDLLLHVHGSESVHIHLVPHETSAHAHAHEGQPSTDAHEREHDSRSSESLGDGSCEYRLCSPGPLLPSTTRSVDSGRSQFPALTIASAEHAGPRTGSRPIASVRKSSWRSSHRKRRSGIASLLTSSRAIRI